MKTRTLGIACGLAMMMASSLWASQPSRAARSRLYMRPQSGIRSATFGARGYYPTAGGRASSIQRTAAARARRHFGSVVGYDGIDGERPTSLFGTRSPRGWAGMDGINGEHPSPFGRLRIRRGINGMDGINGEHPLPFILRLLQD